MANYSYIGYAPGSLVFGGGTISLSGAYDPATGRRVFDVDDAAGGNTLGGGSSRPDLGVVFDGDRYDNEDGDDATQIGDATSLDGSTTFASGNMYLEENYTLNKPGGGTIEVYRVEVDGTLVGYITSEPLASGVSYTFSTSNVVPLNAPDTTDPTALVDVPCFAAGTMIATPSGARAVESIQAGDPVRLWGQGRKTVRWAGARTVCPILEGGPSLLPVKITRGSLGANMPKRDLIVSPNHRILVSQSRAETLFGSRDVLIAAKHLVGWPGITVARNAGCITYVHLLLDGHHILNANGAPSESLYPGDMVLAGMDTAGRDEIQRLFPELSEMRPAHFTPAAPILKGYEARLLSPVVAEPA